MRDIVERLRASCARIGCEGVCLVCTEREAAIEIEQLRKRVPSWQPIETAPKDGTWFLIVRAGDTSSMEVGRYDPYSMDEFEHVEGDFYRKVEVTILEWHGFNNFHRATHWMLPPDPPEAA